MKSKKAKQEEKRLKEENQKTQAFVWILPFLISLILFKILPNEKGSLLSYILVAVLFAMIFSFSKFINSLEVLINIYVPVNTSNKISHDFFRLFNQPFIFVICCFITALFSFIYSDLVTSNQNPLSNLILIGLGIAIVFLMILWATVPSIYSVEIRRFNLLYGSFFGIPLLTLAFTLILNKTLADDISYCENVKVIAKEHSISRTRNTFHHYDITFIMNNLKYKEAISEEQFSYFKTGDKVEVCIIEGYFGYDILEYINVYNPEWKEYEE